MLDGRATDHPVLIPTPDGPVGGIVSQPPEEARAGLVMLPGHGRPARSGTNAFWTRAARTLAELGVVVLRIDYCREGETIPIGEEIPELGLASKLDTDLRLADEAVAWFCQRIDGIPLLFTGSCGGARLSIELAERHPETFGGAFLIVPFLEGSNRPEEEPLDPPTVDRMRAMMVLAPCWILVGERDFPDIPGLRQALGPAGEDLEVESVPGTALHFLDQAEIQEQASSRLAARISRVLQCPAQTGQTADAEAFDSFETP